MENWNIQKRVNWNNDVMPIIKERLSLFNRYGIIPTLKTIFYSLVNLNIIPNSFNYYTYLNKYATKARIKGDLPIGCFPEQDLPRITNSYSEFVNAKDTFKKLSITLKKPHQIIQPKMVISIIKVIPQITI